MSKSVLISIRPEWCEKIASGEKTIEVRKTRPKLPTPFKCYIYCTLDKNESFICRGDDDMPFDVGNGMVIGEFVCDCVLIGCEMGNADRAINEGCIREKDLLAYSAGNPLYGWHISELKIYDTPKELSEFFKPCSSSCNYIGECGGTNAERCLFPMERPPQSWLYVEELA